MNFFDTKRIRLQIDHRFNQIYNAKIDEKLNKNRISRFDRKQIISFRQKTWKCRKTNKKFWKNDDCESFETHATISEMQYVANKIVKQKRQYLKHKQFCWKRWFSTSCLFCDELLNIDSNDFVVEKKRLQCWHFQNRLFVWIEKCFVLLLFVLKSVSHVLQT